MHLKRQNDRDSRPSTRRPGFVLAVVLVALLATALGAAPGSRPRNYDAFYAMSPGEAQSVSRSVAAVSLDSRRVHVEARLGVPSFLWVEGLTSSAKQTPGGDPLERARQVLAELAPLYGLTPGDVASANARKSHDTGSGPWMVTFEREVEGIEVWRDRMSILFDAQGRVVAVSGNIAPESLGVGAPRRFIMRPESVAAIAAGDATRLPFADSAFQVTERDHGRYGYLELTGEGSRLSGEIRFKKVFYHLPDRLVASYYIEFEVVEGEQASHLWGYVVSAEDGMVLNRTSLTNFESFSYRVWADAASPHVPFQGPTADFMPHPTGVPDGSFPAYVSPSLITLQNLPFSRNDPWLAAAATVTNGNNVDAYADISGADGFDGSDIRAVTTSASTFDRTYDTGAEPGASANQRMAAITQLFFVNNFLHDWFYDSGFDEAAGNAQVDNFGRGGLGNDSIRAEAQDSDGTNLNNANMSTPADGSRPRMQMYLWSPASSASVTTTATGGSSLEFGTATFGAQNFNVTATVALANDGSGTATDGCETILNDVSGKIALIDRGTCSFAIKTKNAQNAGAVGVLIANNTTGVGNMSGTDATITIPSMMITQADGTTVKTALGSGAVTATMTRTVGAVKLDGTIDNGIVAHEWGHYLTNRLVALGTNQAGSMGEGWGDFVALLMAVREGDDPDGVYSASQYAMQGTTKDPAYFGIRRYPYSTNMSVNPLTFKHITDGVALPSGPPINANGVNNAEVHNAGEVWAQMLWECYAALLKDTGRLTFAQAQERMKEYLVVSLKMTPADPTFTEARDAVLAAAEANDIADYILFCQAFAKRGIGVGAVSPARDSTTHAGVVESFGCAGDLKNTNATLDDSISGCDLDGILDRGEVGKLALSFKNSGGESLSNSTLTVTSPNGSVSFPNGATVPIPSTTASQTVSVSLYVKLSASVSGTQDLTFNLSYNDPDFQVAGPRTGSVKFEGNIDEQASASASDDVEASITSWEQGGNPTDNGKWLRVADSVTSHRWHADDVSAVSDSSLVSPPLQVAGPLVITFDHRYVFEASQGKNWDGGVIEISTNDGATWTDVGAAASPGYNGTIDNTASNPLGGRQGFTGTSTGHPSYLATTVNLGSTYNGQTVRFRFRLGTDAEVGATGWDVDNIAVSGITNTPFALRSAQPVCAKLSVADATVTEGNSGTTPVDVTVTLVGAPGGTVTVNWETMADGVATSGVDFVADSGSLTFLEGETSKTITVQVIGDELSEVNETFSVHLSGATNATVSDHHGTVTILDNEIGTPTGVTATATSDTSVTVGWSSVPGAVLYQVFRSSSGTSYALLGSTASTGYVDATAASGAAYLYAVKAVDAGDKVSGFSNPDLATTIIFTDPTITAGVTKAKTAHITQLRTAVNAVRTLAGLSAAGFTDPTLTNGIYVKRLHVTELRVALDAARSALGLSALSYTDPTLTVGVTRIKAAHITELREGVK